MLFDIAFILYSNNSLFKQKKQTKYYSMSTDFSKYQKIIDNFRGEVNKPSFDIKFTQNTKQLAKTERFLLKMELKRLASVCTRSIDLRGLVDGECKLFEYSGQSHFLDDVAIGVFKKNVEIYKGYTFGVYEKVRNTENNFRVIYEKEKNNIEQYKPKYKSKENVIESSKITPDKTQYPVTIFPLNQYHDRIEERMNFVTSLDIALENNQKKSVSSIDISVKGLKFRINSKDPLYIDKKITLIFKGLENDFQFSKGETFVYQVKNIHCDENTQLVGCQRIEASDNDAFEKFLLGYIQGNKRRYKINLENTISALQYRTFEQYVLPKINELPIFFERLGGSILPRYVLTTNNNQSIFEYWQDENNNANLHFLVSEDRLTRLLKRHKQGKSLLVYSFVHQNQGKGFFYTIDEEQLSQENDFSSTFLTFAAKKNSFAVTKLTCFAVDTLSIHSPFALSSTLELKKQFINLPPSDEVIECIKSLPFVVVASDITHKNSIEQYQHFSNDEINMSKFKKFGHKRLKDKIVVDRLGITYKNQRQEPRFMYRTPVMMECGKIQWKANSIDFSTLGLKVEVNKAVVLFVGDIVYITLPNLQKITSSHDLKRLPYEVVKINDKKTIINFRVHVKEHQHVGRSFFKLLINKNKDKLTSDEYTFLVPGLAEALRTNYAQGMQVPTLIVQTSGSRYKVEALVTNDNGNEFLQQLKNLSDRKNYYNFYPLLTKLYKDNFIESCLKRLIINKEPIAEVLYISIAKNFEQIDRDVSIKFDNELNTPELRKHFIQQALINGYFFSFQLKISRTNKPDLEYLNTELSYISAYAMHRSKQIEQDIWSVVALIQYVDITDEVLFSHGLNNRLLG
tara:strand:+ start:7049 stop:9607 length:2559 start_codon:yes stop_codon:yes gene_type:complete